MARLSRVDLELFAVLVREGRVGGALDQWLADRRFSRSGVAVQLRMRLDRLFRRGDCSAV